MRTRPEMDWVDISYRIITEGKPSDRDLYELMVSERTIRNLEDHFNALNLDLIKKQELWKSKLPFIYELGVITKDDVSETYQYIRKHYQLNADSEITSGEEFLRSLSLTLFQRMTGAERILIRRWVLSTVFLYLTTCYKLLLKHPSLFNYDSVYVGLLAFNEANGVNWSIELYRKHVDYRLEIYQGLFEYIDVDMLEKVDKPILKLTIKEMIHVGVTHDVIREFRKDLFEGLTRNEFNELIRDLKDNSFHLEIMELRIRNRLVDFLRRRECKYELST